MVLLCFQVLADGPEDNVPGKVRPIPPEGLAVPDEVRGPLVRDLETLEHEIDELTGALKGNSALEELIPDVAVFAKAVRYAIEGNEFHRTNEWRTAQDLLKEGTQRAAYLKAGRAPWTTATGLVVRGYRSRIDDSVQPYGLVVPSTFQPGSAHRHRLDVWFHGRGETLSELAFIAGRQRSPGQFVPEDTIVVHPYGRYCNGSRFAGETDMFEVLEHVKRHYPIDEERQVVRGFSLGGASCWDMAVHHAGMWAAAAPGAGFSETEDFLTTFQKEKLDPPWYQRALWHWYDATDYANNLYHCPTVAYSGEVDRQRQAAVRMETALEKEQMHLVHVIGPDTAHKYHPDSILEINRRIDGIAALGRDRAPSRVRFTTWTLRYNRMLWVTVDGLEEHWKRARVEAVIESDHRVVVTTENVSAITLAMGPGECPLDNARLPEVEMDGRKLEGPPVWSDRSWTASFSKSGRRWDAGAPSGDGLRKRHGLQGPIDDAFMDSFLFVRPTGPALNEAVGAWVASEMNRAVREWRRQYRGDVRIKDDKEVTDADLASHHLVLWGDPRSNLLMARMAAKLPVRWDEQGVHTPEAIYPAAYHVPILVYPNPLNPERYVVYNSGFTFREYAYLNNARQTPKLPDWAIVDVRTPPSTRDPGRIAAAGFFGEGWEWR